MQIPDKHTLQIYVDATERCVVNAAHCVGCSVRMSALFFTCGEASGLIGTKWCLGLAGVCVCVCVCVLYRDGNCSDT